MSKKLKVIDSSNYEFSIGGMTCDSCEKIISKVVSRIKNVKNIDVDYVSSSLKFDYDGKKSTLNKIIKEVEKKGYSCSEPDEVSVNIGGWVIGILGLLIVGYYGMGLIESFEMPAITQNMGYGLLFTVGLLTGFHCVSMCGGFVVGYTAKGVKEGKKPHHMHMSYAIGKTLSYTIIGALFGLLGSIIAFTPMMRGYAGIFAGLFLVIFGLKMLNLVPGLRKFRLTVPKFIAKFVGYESKKHSNNPLVIGLLNGLMIACGPLQAIYIMAAGTGSMVEGAKMLFVFGLGTLPVLLGFGYFTSFVSAKATNKILKASGAIVIILGLIMLNRGIALTGSGYDVNSIMTGSGVSEGETGEGFEMKNGYQIIRMEVTARGWSPDKFVLKKGIPVKWIVTTTELTGCNKAINVPKLNLEFDNKMGEQIIEFTPNEVGKIPFSCWMGMIPGLFVVVEGDEDAGSALTGAAVAPAQGSCGSGGCGCGGK